MKSKVFIISLSAMTLAASAAVFAGVYNITASVTAKDYLAAETADLQVETNKQREANDALQTELDEVETELSTKVTINNYYMEYKREHDELQAEVEDLKRQAAELDARTADKRAELESAAGVAETKRGASYALKKGETYSCPAGIPAGRYTAFGSGAITVLGTNGRARLSQNLDVSYGNSYTFNLSEKEKITVTGDVILTELKARE